VGPVAGIEAGIGWIGAEAQIVVGGMIAAAVAAAITAGDRTVVGVAATAGAITKYFLLFLSFPFSQILVQYGCWL